jgi:hypothetical protein
MAGAARALLLVIVQFTATVEGPHSNCVAACTTRILGCSTMLQSPPLVLGFAVLLLFSSHPAILAASSHPPAGAGLP